MTAETGCSNQIKRRTKQSGSPGKDSCYSLKRYYNKNEYLEKTNDKITHSVAKQE